MVQLTVLRNHQLVSQNENTWSYGYHSEQMELQISESLHSRNACLKVMLVERLDPVMPSVIETNQKIAQTFSSTVILPVASKIYRSRLSFPITLMVECLVKSKALDCYVASQSI